jgi:hypothetical protein
LEDALRRGGLYDVEEDDKEDFVWKKLAYNSAFKDNWNHKK